MWQIQGRSSACLRLRLRVQKKGAVALGGWLLTRSQVRGRGNTGSSFVGSWLLAGSAKPALLALQRGSWSSFPAHRGGSLSTALILRATEIRLLRGCRDASSWLCFKFSTIQTAFRFVDSDRWSLGTRRIRCFADPGLT